MHLCVCVCVCVRACAWVWVYYTVPWVLWVLCSPLNTSTIKVYSTVLIKIMKITVIIWKTVKMKEYVYHYFTLHNSLNFLFYGYKRNQNSLQRSVVPFPLLVLWCVLLYQPEELKANQHDWVMQVMHMFYPWTHLDFLEVLCYMCVGFKKCRYLAFPCGIIQKKDTMVESSEGC